MGMDEEINPKLDKPLSQASNSVVSIFSSEAALEGPEFDC